MTEEQVKEAFEKWASDEGMWMAAIERNSNGYYKLMQTQSHWVVWQAAFIAFTENSAN